MDRETAVFAGGCFWCTEAVFGIVKGVRSVTPGYTGGSTKNPTYEDVSGGTTDHAEAVRIEFDPAVVSYDTLLDVFWNTHNPTTANRQGNDEGSQYRSVIFYLDDRQKDKAIASRRRQAETGGWENPIVTEILPFKTFHPAEEYHKDYYLNHNDAPYCQYVIQPKLASFRSRYGKLTKQERFS